MRVTLQSNRTLCTLQQLANKTGLPRCAYLLFGWQPEFRGPFQIKGDLDWVLNRQRLRLLGVQMTQRQQQLRRWVWQSSWG
jgi:hypothetical protein